MTPLTRGSEMELFNRKNIWGVLCGASLLDITVADAVRRKCIV